MLPSMYNVLKLLTLLQQLTDTSLLPIEMVVINRLTNSSITHQHANFQLVLPIRHVRRHRRRKRPTSEHHHLKKNRTQILKNTTLVFHMKDNIFD